MTTPAAALTARDLWAHLFGDRRDLVAMFSGKRPRPDADLDRQTLKQAYFAFPEQVEQAELWAQRQVGRETYFGAHLVFDERRVKENASPVMAVWADNDTGAIPDGVPRPTARLQSSPGRTHDFWRLARPISPARAELINKRLALAIGADPSGVDLTQLLRVPGTPNWKYQDTPIVQVLEIDRSLTYSADDLEKVLPKLPDQERKASGPAAERDIDKADDELLAVMLRSKHGEKIRALLNNDVNQLATYPELLTDGRLDANKADLSLCNSLAFYLGTVERADAAFRRSKRMRDKWDEKHRGDGATYGEMTLEKAFTGRTEFYTPPGEGLDLAEGIANQQAAVEEAERITKGEGEDLVCIPRSTYEQLLARAAEADRQQAVIQSQRATIAEYHTIQRQEREIFASSLPPAQKLADWAILNVVTAKVSRSSDEQPLYAEEVARLCNVSRDIIGRRLEAQAALGVFTKTTKWDTARLVVNERTGEIRPPRVTRIKPLVSVSEAWGMVAQAAATAPARKRAPVRCELHPTGPIQRKCMAPVGNGAVCGRLLGEDPLFAPHADVGVDEVPEVLPQESAIPSAQRRRGSSGLSMPQESAIPEGLEPTVEDVLGSPDAPIGEPPEEPPDDETRERWRREHYRERYDHAPPPPSPTNGSTNGHHPPPAARPCITAGCDAPLRLDQAFLCDRHRVKAGPPPPGEQPDAVTIRTEKAWRDAGIDVAKLRAAQAAGVDIMAAARATGIESDAAALAAVFPAPRTAELPLPPAHNQEGGQPAYEQ